jgi:predicted nucleotidyltransferase/DNA-binding XRE family transcriptional regulator
MEAGITLREARHAAGMTQVELASRAGVTQSVISAYESGRREPSMPMLERLIEATGHRLDVAIHKFADPPRDLPDTVTGRRVRRHRQRIKRLALERGAGQVRVFGSVARGDDDASSDIDLLVDLADNVGLVSLAGLERELSELLEADVDVIPASLLKPAVKKSAEAEAIVL